MGFSLRRPSLPSFPSFPGRRPPSRPAGLPPGTLIVDDAAHALAIRVFRYDREQLDEHEIATPDALRQLLARSSPPDGPAGAERSTVITWIDITGLGDAESLAALGEILGLHPLTLEDIANVNQRAKVERFGDDLLLFARMLDDEASETLRVYPEQLALLLRSDLVVTFQERPGDCFEPVRRRLRAGNPRIRGFGADYLAYALLDAVVDVYVLVVDGYRDRLEQLEERLLEDEQSIDLPVLHRLRRDLIHINRIALPLRDAVGALLADPARDVVEGGELEASVSDPISDETRLYLRDTHDHAMRTVDRLDAYRDYAASLVEVYLTLLGHRTNEVTQVLTIIATIFIPLSFLAGLYGMNFDTSSPWNLPELSFRYGYPTLLGTMAVIAVLLLIWFRRKGWL